MLRNKNVTQSLSGDAPHTMVREGIMGIAAGRHIPGYNVIARVVTA